MKFPDIKPDNQQHRLDYDKLLAARLLSAFHHEKDLLANGSIDHATFSMRLGVCAEHLIMLHRQESIDRGFVNKT